MIYKYTTNNAFFVNRKQWLKVMFTFQSLICSFDLSRMISTYHARIDLYISVLWLVISDISLYNNLKLFDVWLYWVIVNFYYPKYSQATKYISSQHRRLYSN